MKKIYIFLISTIFVACSTVKLGYNNADWILPWYIDNYFSLEDKQEEFVEERIAQHLEWHRYNELPRYTRFIDEATAKISDGLTGDEYDWILNEILSSYARLIERLLPDATEMLLSLTSRQIDALEQKYNERNTENTDRPQRTEEERLASRQKRTIERMEDWFGYLTDSQVKQIKTLSASLPDNRGWYREDRIRRQQVFLTLLREKPAKDEFIKRLRIHLTDYNYGRPQEYVDMSKAYWEASRQMTLKIDAILTDEQKMNAIEKIKEYQVDFKELASIE